MIFFFENYNTIIILTPAVLSWTHILYNLYILMLGLYLEWWKSIVWVKYKMCYITPQLNAILNIKLHEQLKICVTCNCKPDVINMTNII